MNDTKQISIRWKNGDTSILWNETCAMVVERFGTPGGRYTTHIDETAMQFNFDSEKDATLCRLLLSERL